MIANIVKTVIVGLFRAGFQQFLEWYRRRQLEQARRRAAELEALMAAKAEQEKDEDAYADIVKEHEKAREKERTSREKLLWVQQFNER